MKQITRIDHDVDTDNETDTKKTTAKRIVVIEEVDDALTPPGTVFRDNPEPTIERQEVSA